MTAFTEEAVRSETNVDGTDSRNGSGDELTALEDAVSDVVDTVDSVLATEAAQVPVIKVVKGSPTDADIAALVTVFSAAAGATDAVGPHLPPETWGTPTRMHRGTAPFSPYSFSSRSAE